MTALHTVGFVEALVGVLPTDLPDWTRGPWMRFAYGTITLLLLTIICLFGAELFAKTSFMVIKFNLSNLKLNSLDIFNAGSFFDNSYH